MVVVKAIVAALLMCCQVVVCGRIKRVATPRSGYQIPKEFFMRRTLKLGKGYNLKEVAREWTIGGLTKNKLQETFMGIPVYGVTLVAVGDSGGFSGEAYGHILKNIQEDLSGNLFPRMRRSHAASACKKSHGDARADTVDGQPELLILPGSDGSKARLVYKVSYILKSRYVVKRPVCMVDAISGRVLYSWGGIEAGFTVNGYMKGVGGNDRIGEHHYGGKLEALKVLADINNTEQCLMKNKYVETYHFRNSYAYWILPDAPHQAPCETGSRDETNGARSPLNDAHFYGTKTFEAFEQYLGEFPIYSLPVKLFVHYQAIWYDAFWYGNAAFLGDGNSGFHPWSSSVNIVAHEIGHGYIDRTSGLEYSGESGSISESMADIIGEAVEYFVMGDNDFKVGSHIKKQGGFIRNMKDPTADGYSIDHIRNYRKYTGVHYGNGIYNKVFSILAQKWTTPEAFVLFAYANKMYWGPNTDFVSGACGVIRAAKCDKRKPVSDVVSAFLDVGITCSRAQEETCEQ